MRSATARWVFAALCVFIGVRVAQAQPINILSPEKNSTVSTAAIYVTGTVVANTRQIGVSVNGFRAELDLDRAGTSRDPFRWFAKVPSAAGKVKLTARLHESGKQSADGGAASVIHIEYVPGAEVTLAPSASGGVVPLKVSFDVLHDLSSEITRFEADLDGNGVYEQVSATVPQTLERTYAAPGLVVAAVRMTTADGAVVVAKTGIVAQSFVTMNRVLKDVWSGFTGALSRDDISTGLLYFAEGAPREKYGPVLELIRPSVKEFSSRIRNIAALSIGGDVAYYLLLRDENGVANGHYVYFARDSSGLWKIVQM